MNRLIPFAGPAVAQEAPVVVIITPPAVIAVETIGTRDAYGNCVPVGAYCPGAAVTIRR